MNEKTVYEKLYDWADDRSISKQTPERNSFNANITEETAEFVVGAIGFNTHEIVDALSDIQVFAFTELTKYDVRDKNPTETFVEKNVGEFNDMVGAIVVKQGAYLEAEDTDTQIKAVKDIAEVAWNTLRQIGYDPVKVMNETYKEINSRTGEWNEEAGKWQKYKTDEAKALWYTADYTDCLMDEVVYEDTEEDIPMPEQLWDENGDPIPDPPREENTK